MQYNGVYFEAIIATPGCGKSYLTDNYPDIFVDMDEERLKCKYEIPSNISREELEKTKGDRPYKKRDYNLTTLFSIYDNYYKQGKILLAAPHPECFDYFESRKIKFCFVYPKKETKKELLKRFNKRKNSSKFINDNINKFDEFYISNKNDKKADIHYEFDKNEYLEQILRKFGLTF